MSAWQGLGTHENSARGRRIGLFTGATRAVIAQFPREGAEVRVLNADEWPNRMPTSMAFAEGPNAASDILDLREQRRSQGEEFVSRAAQQASDAS